MKRRKFTQSLFAVASLSSIPVSVSLASAASRPMHELQKSKVVSTAEGLTLSLNQQVNPTQNKDSKQFILTYDVEKNAMPLVEKTYNVKVSGGRVHQIYMSPVADNQLQAVFNWRLNA